MKAIKTRYLGPTDHRGSRIKATAEGIRESVTVPYPHEMNSGPDAHSVAALALCRKMGWDGTLIAGGLDDCYVFTFANSQSYEINLTDEARDKATEIRRARSAAILEPAS